MAQKSYQQYCGIAAALDRVGDRWTLLILRELSFGEQRFTDLHEAMRGIASNLLAERLRDLARGGLVEQREFAPRAARTVYVLTAEGERIRPVLAALATFGLTFLDDPIEGQVGPRTARGMLGTRFDPNRVAGRELLMRFELDGEEFWLTVHAGTLVHPDRNGTPDLICRQHRRAGGGVPRHHGPREGFAPSHRDRTGRRPRDVRRDLFHQ